MTAGLAPGRLASWIVTAVLVGWVVVYNAMRVAGGTPAGVAITSLLIGAAAGLVVLAIAMAIRASLIRSGRLQPVDAEADVPAPGTATPEQARWMGLTWPVIAVAAGAEFITGIWMLIDWQRTPSLTRATAELIMAIWFIFAGLWMLWESRNLREQDAGGIDSVALGALLTTVLAGVGISRHFATPAQVVTVVLAGLASAMAYYLVWFLVRRRGVPWMAGIALIITLASLFLPLATA